MLAAQEDVLVDRELRHQVELLVDHGDAASLGLARVAEGRRLPVEQHLALELGVDAAHDPHERGLAGAVLADEPVDLPDVDVERHVLEATTPGKRLVMSRMLRKGASSGASA